MKKMLSTLLFICLFTLTTMTALAYTGNSNSFKFHSEDCRAEQKIRTDHRVHLETRDQAISSGYTPCGICKP